LSHRIKAAMYRLLLALSVLVPVADTAICAVPCPGFIDGDCQCHDAGPWAMWICTKKDGLLQEQPWFCSQPTCGCNGGGTTTAAPTHAPGAITRTGAPRASPADSSAASSVSATTPQVSATFPATLAAPLVAFAAPQARIPTGPREAAAATKITTEVTKKQTITEILAAGGKIGWPGFNGSVRLPATLRFACAPIRPPSDRFVVDACAEIDPGTLCEVRCSASVGWHGQATIFVCPPGNKNVSQTAVPVPNGSWPNCTQSKNSGGARVNSSGLNSQRAFLETSPLLKRHVHAPTIALLGIVVFACMLSIVSLRRRNRLQQAEAQHFFGTKLEPQE